MLVAFGTPGGIRRTLSLHGITIIMNPILCLSLMNTCKLNKHELTITQRRPLILYDAAKIMLK
jgi:hypothetical protein